MNLALLGLTGVATLLSLLLGVWLGHYHGGDAAGRGMAQAFTLPGWLSHGESPELRLVIGVSPWLAILFCMADLSTALRGIQVTAGAAMALLSVLLLTFWMPAQAGTTGSRPRRLRRTPRSRRNCGPFAICQTIDPWKGCWPTLTCPTYSRPRCRKRRGPRHVRLGVVGVAEY
jgi:hypothetical protein